jgi:hypothetical protein
MGDRARPPSPEAPPPTHKARWPAAAVCGGVDHAVIADRPLPLSHSRPTQRHHFEYRIALFSKAMQTLHISNGRVATGLRRALPSRRCMVLAPCRAKELRSYSEADDEVTVPGAKQTGEGLYVDDSGPRVREVGVMLACAWQCTAGG